jgi:hypothetical protein
MLFKYLNKLVKISFNDVTFRITDFIVTNRLQGNKSMFPTGMTTLNINDDTSSRLELTFYSVV